MYYYVFLQYFDLKIIPIFYLKLHTFFLLYVFGLQIIIYLRMVAHTCNCSTWEAEAGGSPRV